MKHLFTLLALLGVLIPAFGQHQAALDQLNNRGEVYFSISRPEQSVIQKLSKIISIGSMDDRQITAYANRKSFDGFVKLGIDYTVLTPPSLQTVAKMSDFSSGFAPDAWDYYPTYPAYESLMANWETQYPNLCKVVTIGVLPSGRKLLAVRISQYVDSVMNKPQFLYTSSIHGDEISGYVTMLHFIDYLLTNYGTNPKVTNLVNSIDIFINPLANPDGTYKGGNSTVNGATRGNANNIDMNRNFPDPQDGPHPDGNAWQPETVFFMDFASSHQFVMSSNFHCGAEVLNYPWDTWSMLHADDNWWQRISRAYVDTVHLYSPASYFNDLNNGITNGYAWYEIDGGRQDYMNYFHYCREITNEISNSGIPSSSSLVNLWNYNYRSLLNYLEECLYGIRGIVTDSLTGAPLRAKVFINGHDHDSSHVYSFLPIGNYHRLLYPGVYSLTFSKTGYYPKTITGLTVSNFSSLVQDVQLVPISAGIGEGQERIRLNLRPNPANGYVWMQSENFAGETCILRLYNVQGKIEYSETIKGDKLMSTYPLQLTDLQAGIYYLQLTSGSKTASAKLIIR